MAERKGTMVIGPVASASWPPSFPALDPAPHAASSAAPAPPAIPPLNSRRRSITCLLSLECASHPRVAAAPGLPPALGWPLAATILRGQQQDNRAWLERGRLLPVG